MEQLELPLGAPHVAPGAWIQLGSGARYSYGSEEAIPGFQLYTDLIVPLARIPRFLGHTGPLYTVAVHAVVCSWVAGDHHGNEAAFHALVHDNAEALVGDCPSPLKDLLFGFKALESSAARALAATLRYPLPSPEEALTVKVVDLAVLEAERRVLKGNVPWDVPSPAPEDLVKSAAEHIRTLLNFSPAECVELYGIRFNLARRWV
jgi:uncharacterized protein